MTQAEASGLMGWVVEVSLLPGWSDGMGSRSESFESICKAVRKVMIPGSNSGKEGWQ